MSFWTTTKEMDRSKDLYNWNTRQNDNERNVISHVLAFFSTLGSLVDENLVKCFSDEVQDAEARLCFYGRTGSLPRRH